MALRLVIGACSNEYVANWALPVDGRRIDNSEPRRDDEPGKAKGTLRHRDQFETSNAPRTSPPWRMLPDPCAEPISLYWPGSASYWLTGLSTRVTSRRDNVILRLADHEAKAMTAARSAGDKQKIGTTGRSPRPVRPRRSDRSSAGSSQTCIPAAAFSSGVAFQ